MDADVLIAHLRRQAMLPGGSARVPAGELISALRISRPTLMRTVQAAGDQVIAMGQTRRRAYAARRALRGQLAPLPVFQISPQGEARQVASLHLTHGHGCWLDTAPAQDLGKPWADWPRDLPGTPLRDGWHDGLPCMLQDMRPEGFLGRAFARQHAASLQVSDDPREWSDDDVLHALCLWGDDTVGDLIIGASAFQRWAQRRLQAPPGEVTPAPQRAQVWLQRAEQAMALGLAGSSAAGEFPKFSGAVQWGDGPAAHVQHVLVKFSGRDRSSSSQRWADLLVCEHLALQTLRQLGVPAAHSRVLQAGGRTFLEVDRFDRHGAHGRSPVWSWQAVSGAWVGDASGSWPDVGRRLQALGLIAPDDHHSLHTLGLMWHFGRFILNTDMHPGNLSFVPVAGHLRVAPAYDMLPMRHAPMRGVELPTRHDEVALPLPDTFAVARPAAHMARVFWLRASRDARISTAFRAVCAEHARQLARLIRVMG